MVFPLTFILALSLCAQERPFSLAGRRFLTTGTQIKATILTATHLINVSVPLVAELEGDARYCNPLNPPDCTDVVLPRKTRFIGEVLTTKSYDRMNAVLGLAVLPDGREFRISALLLSADGSLGIRGRIKRVKDARVATASLKGALRGAATAAGAAANPVAASAGEAVADEAVKEIDLAQERVDTLLEVPPFTRCLLYLTERLDLAEVGETPNDNASSKGVP